MIQQTTEIPFLENFVEFESNIWNDLYQKISMINIMQVLGSEKIFKGAIKILCRNCFFYQLNHTIAYKIIHGGMYINAYIY